MGAIYFDESLDKKTALLSAIVVPNSIAQLAIESLCKIKKTLFEPKDRDVEFHTVHLFSQQNEFENYQAETIKEIFVTCARSLQQLEVKAFCVYLSKKSKTKGLKITMNFWRTLLTNLDKHIVNTSITEKYFLMIDRCNTKADKKRYEKINNIILKNKLKNLILEPIFYDSKLLSLLQFADFNAWISRRYLAQGGFKYDIVEKQFIEEIFRKIAPNIEKITH